MTPPVSKFSPPLVSNNLSGAESPKPEEQVAQKEMPELETKVYFVSDSDSCFVQTRSTPKGYYDYYTDKQLQSYFDRIIGWKKYSEIPIRGVIFDSREYCSPAYACYDIETNTIHLPKHKRKLDSLLPTIDHEEAHHLYWKEMTEEELRAWTSLYEELLFEVLVEKPAKVKLLDEEQYQWLAADKAHSRDYNKPYSIPSAPSVEYCTRNKDEAHSCMTSIFVNHSDEFQEVLKEKPEEVRKFGQRLWNFMKKNHFKGEDQVDLTPPKDLKIEEVSKVFNEGRLPEKRCLTPGKDQQAFFKHVPEIWAGLNSEGRANFVKAADSPFAWVPEQGGGVRVPAFGYDFLLQVFEEDSQEVQEEILVSLRPIFMVGGDKDKEALTPYLLGFLDNRKEAVRNAAFYLLTKLYGYDLSDLDPKDQAKMINIAKLNVSPYPNEQRIPEKILTENLHDEEFAALIDENKVAVRRFAAFYLRNESVSMGVARPALHKALLDSDAKVRREAVISLAHRGNREDLKYLRQLKRREWRQRVSYTLDGLRRERYRLHGRQASLSPLVDQAIDLIQVRSIAESYRVRRNRAALRRR